MIPAANKLLDAPKSDSHDDDQANEQSTAALHTHDLKSFEIEYVGMDESALADSGSSRVSLSNS